MSREVDMKKEDVIKQVKDKLPSYIDLTKLQYIKYSDIGYFGRVNSEDFITYKDLCEQLDFHEGELMKDNGWLVFWYKGELLYISQHTIRNNLSWDSINEHKLVFGERTIDIGSNNYSIMLPTGGNKDNKGEHSMWNVLLCRVHKDYGTWDKLSNVDLNVNSSECVVGTSSWCQERYDGVHCTYRGHHWMESIHASISSYRSVHYGARLVLKLNLDKPNKVRDNINNDGEKIVNVTNIEYSKSNHTHCKICGGIGSYFDDNDKLVKCCDPKTAKLNQDEYGYYNVKLGSINSINHNGVEHMLDKKLKYDKYMMDTASIWKQLSVCKRNQVGCVIGTDDGRILVNGYNGTISKTDNNCEETCNVCNGENKDCSRCGGKGIISSKFVVHAEQNAITFAAKEGIKLKGTTLYTTTSPCPDCAKLIASTGIRRVLYLDEYKDTSGVDFLNHCGVSCYKI